MPLTPGTKLGPYEVLAPIGAGGMGEVFRARDTRLDREVAIKVLPAAMAQDRARLARFEREAKVLASLNHPNIAQIYGLEESGDTRALVMELVAGATLSGPQPIDTALNYARQIAEALEAAHEKGITHRDLKPANIMITPAGVVKVLDFGLASIPAREAGSDPSNSPTLTMAATQAGTIMGTAAYMSPEQARGKPVDQRADVWAFGVVLYEMLAGKQLFGGGETITDTLASVVKDTPNLDALPKDTPAYVRRLLDRCLRKDLRTRLQSIADARIVIDEPEQQQAAPPAPAKRRSPWWIAAAATPALGLLALAAIHFSEKPPEASPIRFEIAPPDKQNFGLGFAVSPDGKLVAFDGSSDAGTKLWIRPLSSTTAQPVAGTEGASRPFWSPNSRFVGFFANGKLKKVDVTGGQPETLCDVPRIPGGGTWNKDGDILFGAPDSALQRVSQSGGVAVPLSALDKDLKELGHLRPSFLPDGRHYTYIARGSDAGGSVYLASLDGMPRRRILSSSQGVIYSPPTSRGAPGHLLFLRSGTLMAQPFDVRRLELAGDAIQVAERVGNNNTYGYFSVSANGILVYRTGEPNRGQMRWVSRDGKVLGTVGPAGDYFDMSLSPDGKQVAVLARIDGSFGGGDIWLVDVAHNVATRFTFDQSSFGPFVWSPDASRLAYPVSKQSSKFDLFQKHSGGAETEDLLLAGDLVTLPADWSGDGAYLAYCERHPKTGWDLWILSLAGRAADERKPRPFLVTPFQESQAQFSPESHGPPRWVAYTSDESGRPEVYVRPFQTGDGQARKIQISTNGGSKPRWRRDGTELYYVAADTTLMAVTIKSGTQLGASVPKPLFLTNLRLDDGAGVLWFRYSPSADGSKFLILAPLDQTAFAPITAVVNWTAGLKR